MQQITEEQRKRSELNRLAALAKRRDRGVSDHDPWRLFKCRKVSPEPNSTFTEPFKCPPRPDCSGQITKVPAQLNDRFRVRLEICSPDSFSVTPVPLDDFPFPGEAACLEIIDDCLSAIMQSHYTQNTGGGKASVYKLREYDAVLRCFKMSKCIQCEEVPWSTLNVLVKLSDSFTSGRWVPCRPEHLSDETVDELLGRLPKSLVDTLLPFQHEGVRFGLRRGGRCLIADEMGLGKTLQAIAIAGCFLNEGSVLVVCPAILRYAWAEEFEHWLPSCLPCDIHLVFGHQNNPARLVKCPKVVITSYTMLNRLRKSMSQQDWAVLIVDESHHVRCSKQISESDEIKAVLDVARAAKHTVLLSGTPSLSRPYDIFHQINMLWPGLLGKDKYEFAKNYCSVKSVHGFQGKVYKDYSRGVRLEELNVLLKQSVMIRRLKEDVLMQLPPKRRQIISLVLKRSDFNFAGCVAEVVEDTSTNKNTEDESLDIADKPNNVESAGSVAEVVEDTSTNKNTEDESLDIADKPNNVESAGDACCKFSIKITDQELAMAKLSGFREWLSIHPVIAELNADEYTESNSSSHKMIIFAHHHKVLDAVQEFICEKGIEFVRIDGNTHERDRQLYVQSFQSSKQIKIALVGILAGGTGLNLSAAHNVVFLELPKEPAHLLQAEDRAHRRGQTKAVNIYIFCAKDTSDESRWQKLNKSLHRVSSTVNGKYDAIQEIEIDSVAHLRGTGITYIRENELPPMVSTIEHSPVHLMEFPTSINQNLHCDQACGLVDENTRYDEENYNGRISPQKAANFHRNEGSKGIVPKTEKDICTRLSMHSEIDLKENNNIKDRANNQFHEIAMQDNGEPAEIVAAASVIDSLRFEVSQYSGRIHLYTCSPGVDSRPRPLFENFRPEELVLQHPSATCSQRMTYSCIKDDPNYRHILLEFIEEWKKLRPIEQKKLLAKPLQLPLSVELCCLNNSINHDFGGLLKGKSKKRTTSLHEISYPLPTDSVWRKISLCSGRGKKEKVYEQGWTLSDEPLCKLCQIPCKGRNAKVPEYFEDLFCNLSCYEEFRLRTSNRSLREGLFQMEHGVCTSCHLDCHKLVEHTKRLPLEKRESYIKKVAPDLANRPKLLEKLVREPSEGNAWHADHIVPVYLGGGECKLENMRTLCVVCHARVTKEQCAERRSTRLKAKKQLKELMIDLRNAQNLKQNYSEEKESRQKMIEDDAVDDDLLIEVPGSAYCNARNISTGSE
ncbi:uncharacterized protein LOC141723593 [Apium graveolens]|uniref:uncharacterized protein LOC141723593 n=1 Tax=Apium graveolens TaxID=4045 RepID=UPI003D7A08F3